VQDFHVVFADNRLSIDKLALQRAGQTVSVQGSAATDGPLDLTLQVKQLSLAEFKPLLAEGPPVNGVLSADVRVQGTTANPDVTASVTTDALTVAGQTYAGLTVEGVLQNKRLQVDVALRQDATHTLTVNGVAPVNLPGAADSSAPTVGEVDLRVRSDGLSLAFLELLSKDIQEVKGKATVDLAVRGPVTVLAASGPGGTARSEVRGYQCHSTVVAEPAHATPVRRALGRGTGVRSRDRHPTGL
jgi:autotransporter translocation and assembly factor TamB